jgi:hypothetical protein|nr:MAG TPA: hypothetical protein [Bacteriophage sp.]
MQQSLINQIEDFVESLKSNKNDNIEFRIVFGDDFKSDLIVLFEDEFDKISDSLKEFEKQMDVGQFPDSYYAICQHPEIEETKLKVFSFQTARSPAKASHRRFVFLKGVRNITVDLNDYLVQKQVKF